MSPKFNFHENLLTFVKLNLLVDLVWFGLVWFYGISTIVGYLMPNLVYIYTLNI